MNGYKVPQDVEAEDKLLGPFGFRQLIYLGVVALSLAGAFGLFQMFPPLVIIPLPFVIFFGALALPLRKDQPMEIYLAAVLSFLLKPRKRIWQADGVEHLIQITAPKVPEPIRTKDLSRDEAARRLSYLSDVVDTGGWVIKNAVSQNSSIHDDFINEASTTEDMFENTRISNNIDSMIALNDKRRKQQIINNMNTARDLSDFTDKTAEEIQTEAYSSQDYYEQALRAASQNGVRGFEPQSVPPEPPIEPAVDNYSAPDNTELPQITGVNIKYNPYPDSIRQTVIRPISEQPAPENHQPQPSVEIDTQAPHNNYIQPSSTTPFSPSPSPQITDINPQPTQHSPAQNQPNPPQPIAQKPKPEKPNDDIIKLVSEGKDLSVETLARQAQKIQKREEAKKAKANEGDLDDGVFISLR